MPTAFYEFGILFMLPTFGPDGAEESYVFFKPYLLALTLVEKCSPVFSTLLPYLVCAE